MPFFHCGAVFKKLCLVKPNYLSSACDVASQEKLQAGERTTSKDFNNINFAHVEPPKTSTWQDIVKLALLDQIGSWLVHPESTERLHKECRGGGPSNILSLFRDSLEFLNSSDSENLTLIGKVVSPKETSMGRPKFLKQALAKLLRLPPYKAEHHLFLAVTLDIQEAMAAIRLLTNVYTQNEAIFENQEVFVNAVLELFAHYEQHYRLPSRGSLGVRYWFNSFTGRLHASCIMTPRLGMS